FAGLPPPEQIEQAMRVLRDQDGHALGAVAEADSPVHPVLARQRGKRGVELVPAQGETLTLDLHPQEERVARWIAHMLVGAEDVSLVQRDEARDRRDQTFLIGAVDQQPDGVAHGQTRRSATDSGSPDARYTRLGCDPASQKLVLTLFFVCVHPAA